MGPVIVGVVAFTQPYASTHGGNAGFSLSGGAALGAMLVTLLLGAMLMVLHELIPGVMMQRFGARRTYEIGVAGRVVPYACCTTHPHRFEKRQVLSGMVAGKPDGMRLEDTTTGVGFINRP